MFGAIFILFVLPWLDTSKVRSAVFRPIYRQFYWIFVIDVLMLGYMGAMPAEGIYLVLARVGTIYYFLHFIVVLPVVGLLEKTDPILMSISEPVLTGHVEPSLAKKTMANFKFKKLLFFSNSFLLTQLIARAERSN